jgi:hypothetical protein
VGVGDHDCARCQPKQEAAGMKRGQAEYHR